MTAAVAAYELHRRRSVRRASVILVACLTLLTCFLLDVATGPAFLSLVDVSRSLLRIGGNPTADTIVWSLRLPIALMAIVVGAALGLTGALMQTVLHNPLASSYTLGISAGAGFGAALAIVVGAGLGISEASSVPVCAFVFAGLSCLCVYLIGSRHGANPQTLVLGGIALLFLFQALLSLLQFVASPEALEQIVFWLFGSLLKSTWARLAIVAMALLASLPVVALDVWRLTALKLGDERARSLGVNLRGLRVRTLTVVSLLTGAAVAFVGTIGFIGLVAPHMARMLVGEDQRYFLPASAIFGALTLSAASVASKTIIPGAVFPIGIMTSLIGIPFFLWLILNLKGGLTS